MSIESRALKYWGIMNRDHDRVKMPRRVKKYLLGCKLSRRQLRAMIKNLPEKFNWDNRFCPRCGCQHSFSTGNMVEYPDLWEQGFCLRCGYQVLGADNSRFYHCLEFPPDFELEI